MKALALIYVILGILPFIILTTTLLYGQTEPSGTLVTPALALTTTVVNNKLITRIIIPKLSTNLSVKPAAIVENTWKAFDDAASLAAGTPVNNIVIFAHDKPKMFRGLGNLEINDPIYIMRNKSYETYYVISKEWVSPSDIKSVMTYQTYQTLTLFTCDGYNDESRVVVKAILKGGEI